MARTQVAYSRGCLVVCVCVVLVLYIVCALQSPYFEAFLNSRKHYEDAFFDIFPKLFNHRCIKCVCNLFQGYFDFLKAAFFKKPLYQFLLEV